MTGQVLEIDVPPDEPSVVFRRVVQAPPSLVFRAWTEPAHLRQWFGPRGYALVVCEIDLRVGGGYRFVQRAPDGRDYVFHGEYLEIDRPNRLVSTSGYEGAPGDESVQTLAFEATDGGGTLVTCRTIFPSFAARDFFTGSGMERGLRETQQRLGEWLEVMTSPSGGER